MWETSIEVYYKDMFNQIEYREGYTPSLNDPEDEFVFGEEGGGAEVVGVAIRAVRGDAVGSALEEDGVSFCVAKDVFGDVDAGEEMDAVAHGDAVVVLGVGLADEGVWRRSLRVERC